MTTPTRTLMRAGLAAVATAAIAAVGLGAGATPAAAHAYLVDSTPQDGATVDEPPTEIVLEFNEPIQSDFTQVAVLDENEQPVDLDEPEVDGPLVTQPVDELAPGAYQVNYRVGSTDGHPVSGTVTFTVTAAALSSPTPTPATAQPTPATEPVAAEEDSTAALWLGGAAAAVIAGAAALVLVLRRRPSRGGDAG